MQHYKPVWGREGLFVSLIWSLLFQAIPHPHTFLYNFYVRAFKEDGKRHIE